MVVAEEEPTGDEQADFADMLKKFKQGVAENVDAEDYQSHYDLAIAFKEMGLVDESHFLEGDRQIVMALVVLSVDVLGDSLLELLQHVGKVGLFIAGRLL